MLLSSLEDQGLYLLSCLKPHGNMQNIGNSRFKDIVYQATKDNDLWEMSNK